MGFPKVVGVRHGRLQRLITKKSFVKHLHEGILGHIVETSNEEAYLGERTTDSPRSRSSRRRKKEAEE